MRYKFRQGLERFSCQIKKINFKKIMAASNNPSYVQARFALVSPFEVVNGRANTAFYLDDTGYPTIGYGTLIVQGGKAAAFAQTSIDNSSDPAFTRKLVDAMIGVTGNANVVKTSLEAKGFVFEGTNRVGYTEDKGPNGTAHDVEGGGTTSTSLVTGLQTQLAQTIDAAGNSYAMIPSPLRAAANDGIWRVAA